MAELTMAVKYKMNITHVLLNNNELGKISKEQKAGNWDVWSTSLHNPNFSKFAQNYGIFGIQVSKKSPLRFAVGFFCIIRSNITQMMPKYRGHESFCGR